MAARIRLLEVVEDVRGSYWFVPGLMAAAGFAAGLALVLLDARLGDAWLGRFEWFYGSRPEGARAVLSTIASSTITVAGVVFSITLAAVTYASGQYGPRLLLNFQRDRGNQVTLGTFVATFLYCLVVLRTIRSAEEASADTGGVLREAFVPHLAVYGSLALAVASIVVLIYFVHHVTDGIHINNALARIGRQLIEDIRAFPKAGETETGVQKARLDTPRAVPAAETGYVEAVDRAALVALASRRELILRLLVRPGDFVIAGQPLIEASPASSVDRQVIRDGNSAFTLGRKRTPLQDLRFAIDELVEIAARALSPGVNDPFTAIACIDWLGAAVAELAEHGNEPRMVKDGEGQVRLWLEPLTFADYVASAFGQLRPYAARDPNARACLRNTLTGLTDRTRDPAKRRCIHAELERLLQEKG